MPLPHPTQSCYFSSPTEDTQQMSNLKRQFYFRLTKLSVRLMERLPVFRMPIVFFRSHSLVMLLVICNIGHSTHFLKFWNSLVVLVSSFQLVQTDESFWWNNFLFSACLFQMKSPVLLIAGTEGLSWRVRFEGEKQLLRFLKTSSYWFSPIGFLATHSQLRSPQNHCPLPLPQPYLRLAKHSPRHSCRRKMKWIGRLNSYCQTEYKLWDWIQIVRLNSNWTLDTNCETTFKWRIDSNCENKFKLETEFKLRDWIQIGRLNSNSE